MISFMVGCGLVWTHVGFADDSFVYVESIIFHHQRTSTCGVVMLLLNLKYKDRFELNDCIIRVESVTFWLRIDIDMWYSRARVGFEM